MIPLTTEGLTVVNCGDNRVDNELTKHMRLVDPLERWWVSRLTTKVLSNGTHQMLATGDARCTE